MISENIKTQTETLNYNRLVRYAKRIEKGNLKKNGTSLTWGSMLNDVNILVAHHGSHKVEVEANWEDKLNKHKK